MPRKLLTGDELTQALKDLPGWTVEGPSLTQTRTFTGFLEAMRFVNSAAELAEELGHHPDLDIRYNKVKVALTTHDRGGITDMDLAFATRLSRI